MNRLKHKIVEALCDRYQEPPMFDPRLLAIRDQYIGQTPFADCSAVVVTVRREVSHEQEATCDAGTAESGAQNGGSETGETETATCPAGAD